MPPPLSRTRAAFAGPFATHQAMDHLVHQCRHLLAAQRLPKCPEPRTQVDGCNIGPESEGFHVANDGVGDGVVAAGACLFCCEVEHMVCATEASTCSTEYSSVHHIVLLGCNPLLRWLLQSTAVLSRPMPHHLLRPLCTHASHLATPTFAPLLRPLLHALPTALMALKAPLLCCSWAAMLPAAAPTTVLLHPPSAHCWSHCHATAAPTAAPTCCATCCPHRRAH